MLTVTVAEPRHSKSRAHPQGWFIVLYMLHLLTSPSTVLEISILCLNHTFVIIHLSVLDNLLTS